MQIKELIEKKKEQELGYEDCHEFANILVYGSYDQKQVVEFVKLLDAIGCSDEEVYNLALAFADSGKRLDCSQYFNFCVDKHSAGLVSDAMTIVLMSVLPCVNITFAKSVNSKYGTFGSFAERLKSISGFKIESNIKTAVQKAKQCGVFLYEDDGSLQPAATIVYEICKNNNVLVEPIVSSTIIANKIVTGANSFVADIKVGEGAVYSSVQSEQIAQRIVRVAKLANIKAVAVLTDLNWPISASVGTRLEMLEVKSLLSNQKDYNGSSLLTLAKEMVVCLLLANKKAATRSEAGDLFDSVIASGKAYNRFCNIVETYGGTIVDIDRKETMLDTAMSYLVSGSNGYVRDIKLKGIYKNTHDLISFGADFDESAGLVLMVKEGDKVVAGQKLAKVFYSHNNKRYFALHDALCDSIEIADYKPTVNNLFYKVIV